MMKDNPQQFKQLVQQSLCRQVNAINTCKQKHQTFFGIMVIHFY